MPKSTYVCAKISVRVTTRIYIASDKVTKGADNPLKILKPCSPKPISFSLLRNREMPLVILQLSVIHLDK